MARKLLTPLTPLNRAYKVDEAINTPQNRLVIIRFGKDDRTCKEVDKLLDKDAKTYDAKAYAVAMENVPELVARYDLSGDHITILFFADKVQVRRLNLDASSASSDGTKQKLKKTFELLVEQRKENDQRASGNQSAINARNITHSIRSRQRPRSRQKSQVELFYEEYNDEIENRLHNSSPSGNRSSTSSSSRNRSRTSSPSGNRSSTSSSSRNRSRTSTPSGNRSLLGWIQTGRSWVSALVTARD